jgi:hypothetical protein
MSFIVCSSQLFVSMYMKVFTFCMFDIYIQSCIYNIGKASFNPGSDQQVIPYQ